MGELEGKSGCGEVVESVGDWNGVLGEPEGDGVITILGEPVDGDVRIAGKSAGEEIVEFVELGGGIVSGVITPAMITCAKQPETSGAFMLQ